MKKNDSLITIKGCSDEEIQEKFGAPREVVEKIYEAAYLDAIEKLTKAHYRKAKIRSLVTSSCALIIAFAALIIALLK